MKKLKWPNGATYGRGQDGERLRDGTDQVTEGRLSTSTVALARQVNIYRWPVTVRDQSAAPAPVSTSSIRPWNIAFASLHHCGWLNQPTPRTDKPCSGHRGSSESRNARQRKRIGWRRRGSRWRLPARAVASHGHGGPFRPSRGRSFVSVSPKYPRNFHEPT